GNRQRNLQRTDEDEALPKVCHRLLNAAVPRWPFELWGGSGGVGVGLCGEGFGDGAVADLVAGLDLSLVVLCSEHVQRVGGVLQLELHQQDELQQLDAQSCRPGETSEIKTPIYSFTEKRPAARADLSPQRHLPPPRRPRRAEFDASHPLHGHTATPPQLKSRASVLQTVLLLQTTQEIARTNIWKEEWNQLNTRAQDWMERGITPTECVASGHNRPSLTWKTFRQSIYESMEPPDRRHMQLWSSTDNAPPSRFRDTNQTLTPLTFCYDLLINRFDPFSTRLPHCSLGAMLTPAAHTGNQKEMYVFLPLNRKGADRSSRARWPADDLTGTTFW
ncbi:hypothetical protein FQN60_014340, partial [Etheostoma spectabile]